MPTPPSETLRALRVAKVRVSSEHVERYHLAFARFRGTVSEEGWHAWLFRGREENLWLEFLEGRTQSGGPLPTLGHRSQQAAAAMEGLRELLDESWWEECITIGKTADTPSEE